MSTPSGVISAPHAGHTGPSPSKANSSITPVCGVRAGRCRGNRLARIVRRCARGTQGAQRRSSGATPTGGDAERESAREAERETVRGTTGHCAMLTESTIGGSQWCVTTAPKTRTRWPSAIRPTSQRFGSLTRERRTCSTPCGGRLTPPRRHRMAHRPRQTSCATSRSASSRRTATPSAIRRPPPHCGSCRPRWPPTVPRSPPRSVRPNSRSTPSRPAPPVSRRHRGILVPGRCTRGRPRVRFNRFSRRYSTRLRCPPGDATATPSWFSASLSHWVSVSSSALKRMPRSSPHRLLRIP